MKQVDYIEDGKYYVVYAQRRWYDPYKEVSVWRYHGDSHSAGHTYYCGHIISLSVRGHTSHSNTGTFFHELDNIPKKYCHDFAELKFFELDSDEIEKHVLIYGI